MGGPHAYAVPLTRSASAWTHPRPCLQEQLHRSVIALDEGAALNARYADGRGRGGRRLAIDDIILGCADLPLLLDQDVADPSVIDPTQLPAEAALRQAMD